MIKLNNNMDWESGGRNTILVVNRCVTGYASVKVMVGIMMCVEKGNMTEGF